MHCTIQSTMSQPFLGEHKLTKKVLCCVLSNTQTCKSGTCGESLLFECFGVFFRGTHKHGGAAYAHTYVAKKFEFQLHYWLSQSEFYDFSPSFQAPILVRLTHLHAIFFTNIM